jgi:hypothetical protein
MRRLSMKKMTDDCEQMRQRLALWVFIPSRQSSVASRQLLVIRSSALFEGQAKKCG